jgi:hypothetical protein
MKRLLLLLLSSIGLLLVLAAGTADAAGLSLSWRDYCWADEGARSNLTWVCNSNTNSNIRMTCSFQTARDHADFRSAEVSLLGMMESATLPDWWELGRPESGDCRAGLMTASADGSVLNGGASACVDPWQGLGIGGLSAYTWDGNRMYVSANYALATPVALTTGTEYFAVQFRVSAERTVGTCPGCLIPAIWALERIELGDVTTPPEVLEWPYVNGNWCLTWQSTGLPCWPGPARNTTWGQIKSLYR